MIDDREHGVRDELCKCNIEHEARRLMIADILVTGENQDDVHLAIERKTVEDLRSSLRDGRFAEQRSRMILHYGNYNCVYIIEGTCGQTETGVLLSMQFRDRITVIRTSDMKETVHIVSKLSSLAEEDRLRLRDRPPEAFAKVNKVPTSDSKCCLAAFLANIPGVSRKMALCIGAHYDGPGHLFECLSHPDGVDALKNIQFGSRKIGPSISAKIAVAFKD